ncbi:hypothetical protein GCM10018779_54800 [Streptomyces griseocarneus]|nr:hypothetical protein GCM10018779_54800 [Streptomyces griseocarneus]
MLRSVGALVPGFAMRMRPVPATRISLGFIPGMWFSLKRVMKTGMKSGSWCMTKAPPGAGGAFVMRTVRGAAVRLYAGRSERRTVVR